MWSDRETERDCLGYQSYVSVLNDVCILKDIAPLTLGIFGSWGSGKTSLMKMLKASIESAAKDVAKDDEKPQIKTLWFNAWRYEGKEEAQSALIHAILARLRVDQSLLAEVKELGEKLKKGASIIKLSKCLARTAVTMTPDVKGFVDSFKDESQLVADTMESFEEDFDSLLERAKVERMVVFIDDLDRCSAAKVIETFETIKLFLNTPKCTFVIGADPEKIKAAVGEVYKSSEANVQKDYLEKIVQIPFNIPVQNLADITCYIGMLILGRCLREEGWKSIVDARASFYKAADPVEAFIHWGTEHRTLFEFDGRDLSALLEEIKFVLPFVNAIARGLKGNPRQIKRFLNILALRRRLATANDLPVKPELIIKLGVLEYVWDDFFSTFVQTLDPDTGNSELLDQVLAAKHGEEQDSPLVRETLGRPALLSYLNSQPKLTGDIDYRPYLFLAQTALHRPADSTLQPVDEEASRLASTIAGADPILARAAGKQAAARDIAVVSAIVPLLSLKLKAASDPKVQANIVMAMDAIARRHRPLFQQAIDMLDALGSSDNDGVALAATALIKNARTESVSIPDGLEDRYRPKSKVLAALTGEKKSPR